MSDDTQKMLDGYVQGIADEIGYPDKNADWWTGSDYYEEGEEPSGYAYICDALDIEHTISSANDHLGSRIAVVLGGPNIFINTRENRVEGYWGGTTSYARYVDRIGIDDAAEEVYWNSR